MRPENTTKGLPLPLLWLLQSAIYFQEKKEPRSFVQNGFGGDYAHVVLDLVVITQFKYKKSFMKLPSTGPQYD